MPDALAVHVNGDGVNTLKLPDSFESSESFDVRLVNHGEATHVHLHLDDALSDLATVEAPNHHVARNSERRVRVTLTEDGATRGSLKVVTAYGATTRYVDVKLTEPETTTEPVEVSEKLAKPQPRPTSESTGVDIPFLPVVAVGSVAVVLAVGAAAVVQELAVVVAAAVVALVAVVAIVVAWAN